MRSDETGEEGIMKQAVARRPRFFNVLQVQMPVGAVTSFAHRVSGIVLALAVPFYLHVLQLSLQGQRTYALAVTMLTRWPWKALVIVTIWALAHHVLAGLRHLLGDVDIGSRLRAARRSAWFVNAAGVVIALLCAGALL